jgi:membrane protein YqaA with SNARE-associated domain
LPELRAHVALAASAFLSATLLPGSSEVALVAAVVTWPPFVTSLFIVATLANTAGSCVNWWLGLNSLCFQDRRWFPVKPAALAKAQQVFSRYGTWTLLFAWLPVIGDPLALAAGLLKMRFLPFALLVLLGKAARYGALLAGAAALS